MPRVANDEPYVPSIDAERRSIEEVLGMSRCLVVPMYQRSFAWTKSHLDELWEDLRGILLGNDKSYFLGPMVFVRSDANLLEVVDGQQRLAALSLLFAVIRDAYALKGLGKKAQIIGTASLTQQPDLDTEQASPKLTLNETDNTLFQEIVDGGRSRSYFYDVSRDKTMPESVKLLAQAYVNIYDRLAAQTGDFADVDALNQFAQALLRKVEIIEIMTTDEDAAYVLFETLNDRGVDLTLSDLLKNYLFRKAKGSRLPEVRQKWTELMATIGQGRMTQFIRHEWMSRNGKVREPVLYRKLKETIRTSADVISYVTGLRKAADVYVALSNPTSGLWRSYAAETRDMLRQIQVFGVVQCYPLLLSAKEARSRKEFGEIAKWVVALTVRYNIIGGKGTGNLESAYAKASPLCHDRSLTQADIKKVLLEIYPDDNEFESSFAVKRISEEPIARLILAELEKSVSGTDAKVADPEALTLEHVLPKSPGATWPSKLASPPRHGELLNRLGNLTLLTGPKNSSLPDDYASKKGEYAKSDIAITQGIASFQTWNDDSVDKRQEELASHAVKVWRLV